jgi:hypothetical protein
MKVAVRPSGAVCWALVAATGLAFVEVASFVPKKPTANAAEVALLRADSWVTKASPDANFGRSRRLRVAGGPVERSYLRFRLPSDGIDADARMVLRLFVSSGSGGRIDVHRTRGGWTERTITFSSAPRPASVLGSAHVTGDGWVTIDLGPPPASERTINLVLTRPRRSRVRFASRESDTHGPRLVLEAQMDGVTRVYAIYYLWWTTRHWYDRLGPSFPYDQDPLPLPATLDASGCDPQSLYEGNQLTDSPPALYTQDDPAVIEQHVRAAASAGLSGFVVAWHGTGESDQTSQDIGYSRRLEMLVAAVHRINAEGVDFTLWLGYEASATLRSAGWIEGDLTYLERHYADDPAFDRSYSDRPMLVWIGSRKYPLDVLERVTEAHRDSFFFVGDENWKTWTPARSQLLDGDQYYWSSQDPYGNPASFGQLASLADLVRSSGPNPDGSDKLWFAPFAPGYNSILLGGSTCVPRNDGETMRLLFEGNAESEPDAWVFISWNEISEGTYIEPLQRYGHVYLRMIEELIASATT